MKTVVLVAGLLLASVAVGAADMPGSRDLEFLPRFPQAQIVDFREVAVQERVYPQGSIRRISDHVRYERQVAAQGPLTILTYGLPRTSDATHVFNHARQDLQAQDAQLLYWCQGRECGSSSLWANTVFGQARLYGVDDQQAYALLRLAPPRENQLLALYSITRGNRQGYLHVEHLVADAPLGDILPTPATLLRQLRSSGELKLPTQDEPTEAWSTLLGRSLMQDSSLRISLSGPRAQAWREALIEQGIRAGRLELETAGQSSGLRVEVLRQ
ncbi:MAG: DUF4892 domain-containing protein [Pseudomonadota bacterium]